MFWCHKCCSGTLSRLPVYQLLFAHIVVHSAQGICDCRVQDGRAWLLVCPSWWGEKSTHFIFYRVKEFTRACLFIEYFKGKFHENHKLTLNLSEGKSSRSTATRRTATISNHLRNRHQAPPRFPRSRHCWLQRPSITKFTFSDLHFYLI